MGERVIVSLDALGLNVGGALAEKIWTALRAAGIEPLKVSRHGDGWMASVEVPDEAATQPVDAGGPFSALDTWMFRAKKAEAALAAQAKQASTCWRTRAEKAEAAAEENCRRAERAGCASMFDAAERSKLERRIVVLDDELSKLRRQPTAGDRVRGLESALGALVSTALRDGFRSSQAFAADLLPLIAAELDKQDAAEKFLTWVQSMPDPGSTVLAEGAGGVASAKSEPEAHTACSGPVTLVHGERERYGTVYALATAHVVVNWREGGYNHFSREDGSCIESTNGIMRGWRIHPDELPRFQVKEKRESTCERTVTAPDGARIAVRRFLRHEKWFTMWVVGDRAHEGPQTGRWFECRPTDAEVLADYEAWRADQPRQDVPPTGERVIVAPDGTAILVAHHQTRRHEAESWTSAWNHGDPDPRGLRSLDFTKWDHNPTDAEVLADYAAWTERTKR